MLPSVFSSVQSGAFLETRRGAGRERRCAAQQNCRPRERNVLIRMRPFQICGVAEGEEWLAWEVRRCWERFQLDGIGAFGRS